MCVWNILWSLHVDQFMHFGNLCFWSVRYCKTCEYVVSQNVIVRQRGYLGFEQDGLVECSCVGNDESNNFRRDRGMGRNVCMFHAVHTCTPKCTHAHMHKPAHTHTHANLVLQNNWCVSHLECNQCIHCGAVGSKSLAYTLLSWLNVYYAVCQMFVDYKDNCSASSLWWGTSCTHHTTRVAGADTRVLVPRRSVNLGWRWTRSNIPKAQEDADTFS